MLGGFLLLASVVLEGIAVHFLIRTGLTGEGYSLIIVGLHLASSASLTEGMRQRLKKERGSLNWLLLGTALALAIPVWGLLGVLTLFLLRNRLQPEAGSDLCDEYKKYMNYYIRRKRPGREMINPPEFVRRGTQIEPVVQWLRDKDPGGRIRAAGVLGRLGDKSSMEKLHRLTKDIYPAVRSEAAAHISKGHESFTTTIFQAKKEVASQPEKSESHQVLANTALEYCESGLLDGQAKRIYLNLAEAEYRKSLTLEANQIEVYNNLGRISIIKRNFLEARKQFKEALSYNPHNLRALLGTAQCHYELREYEKIPRLCNRIREKHPHPDRFSDIINFWTEETDDRSKE